MSNVFNVSNLSKCCGTAVSSILKGGARYAFKDNGSTVLGVCHLDTVQKPTAQIRRKIMGKKTHLYNPVLDDRLGLYTLIYHLPTYHGIKLDWLFTTDEEIGNTSARDFVKDYKAGKVAKGKQWNWMVEFDRGGTDVALYSYGDAAFKEILNGYYPKLATGIFTDITSMTEIGVKAFNVGVAYADYHQLNAYFVLEDYLTQIDRFVEFYRDYKGEKLPHTEPAYKIYGGYTGNIDWWNYDYNEPKKSKKSKRIAVGECSICACEGAINVSTLINGEELFLCNSCIETIVDEFYT